MHISPSMARIVILHRRVGGIPITVSVALLMGRLIVCHRVVERIVIGSNRGTTLSRGIGWDRNVQIGTAVRTAVGTAVGTAIGTAV